MKNNAWLAGDVPRNESGYTAPLFVESTGISMEKKGKISYISGHITQGGFNWIISGTLERSLGSRQILAGPGHFFFNVSGEEVFFRVVSERCVWRWVALSGPLSDAILLSYRYARHQIPDHPYPTELFAKLDELMSRSSPFHTRLKAALILEILAYATGAGSELGESPKIIDRGLSLIKRELSNPDLCVDYLCQHLGISPATLTRIFRQAEGSRIIMNAHRINRGEAIDMRGGKDSDFFFASRDTNEEVVETLVRWCTKNLPQYYHVDALQDIQVLTPMQRGVCGAANLNQVLQAAMNPSKIFLQRGGIQYRLRDKVMQIRNDYDKEVFNGDIGVISKVDMEERELTVDFDGRAVVYDASELDELTLAYATTIHKAQGSEYPIVVMPFTMSHFVMLQRNLLYTGVTRAKKILVLIGERRAVYYAIHHVTTDARNTKLAQRLQEALPE